MKLINLIINEAITWPIAQIDPLPQEGPGGDDPPPPGDPGNGPPRGGGPPRPGQNPPDGNGPPRAGNGPPRSGQGRGGKPTDKDGEGDQPGETWAERIAKELDKRSDDHKPGNEAAKKNPMEKDKRSPEDIDEKNKQITREMEESKDAPPKEIDVYKKSGKRPKESIRTGQPGTGRTDFEEVDYSKIEPSFKWDVIVSRFLKSAKPAKEETYSRPSRRSTTSMDIIRQTGAGAIKPAVRDTDHIDLNLAFVLDTSGSMSSDIGKVFANAHALLKNPKFAKSEVFILTFTHGHRIYKGVFATNTAKEVNTTAKQLPNKQQSKQQAQQAPSNVKNMKEVFTKAESGGTVFTPALTADVANLLSQNYNVLLITDSDILGSENLRNVMSLIKKNAARMFIIFSTRDCYIEWRKHTGINTANITHFPVKDKK